MMGSQKMHYGDLYNLIINVTQTYGQNLQDGSFVMSKFLVEFGIIGVFISLLYIKFIITFLLNIKKI